MKTLTMRFSASDPAFCAPGHKDTSEVVRLGYQSFPDLFRAGEPAVFIHPRLQQLPENKSHLAVLLNTTECVASYEVIENFIHLDIQALPMKIALTAVQTLLMYLGTFLLSDQAGHIATTKFLNTLSEWTQILLTSAETKMPRNVSPWQEWLFAESVRRTIIISYALSMTVVGFRYCYCSNRLFLEPLPFDKRAGLWMAKSPQVWIAAACAKTGEKVGEQLVSVHEFVENIGARSDGFCGDRFLSLVAVGHGAKKEMSGGI